MSIPTFSVFQAPFLPHGQLDQEQCWFKSKCLPRTSHTVCTWLLLVDLINSPSSALWQQFFKGWWEDSVSHVGLLFGCRQHGFYGGLSEGESCFVLFFHITKYSEVSSLGEVWQLHITTRSSDFLLFQPLYPAREAGKCSFHLFGETRNITKISGFC